MKIQHKNETFFEKNFATKKEAEKTAKREYAKLNKNPIRTMSTNKSENPKEKIVFPKSSVKGVQFRKNHKHPWVFIFARNRKLFRQYFKTEKEAEGIAFAHHKSLGITRAASDVRCVYFTNRRSKPWEVKLVHQQKLAFSKRYKTKKEAEKDSKREQISRNIDWRKKKVSKKSSNKN